MIEPLIIIGTDPEYPDWRLMIACLIGRPGQEPYEDVLKYIKTGNYIIYNMAKYPERGDALDAINESTPAVIAMHLQYDEPSLFPGYYYNKRNTDILEITRRLGIPLFVWGDQPTIYSHIEDPYINRSPVFRIYNLD